MGKITEKELLTFTKSVYYLLNGKISLIDTLTIVSQNYKSEMKNKILKTKAQIEQGVPLTKAFYKIVQEREFLEMIKIGEQTGNLELVFKNLYQKYEFNQKIKKDIIGLSIYPVTVIVTAVIIVAILLKFVVPKFVSIYSDIGQDLPKITKTVINMSKIFDKYWIAFFGVMVFIYFLFFYFKKKNEEDFEKFFLKLRIIGKMYKDICVLNFTRNMYSLTNTNISFVKSLEMCSNSKSNVLNKELKKIISKIEKGESIQKSFKNTTFFDAEYRSFLTIGERT